jgi:hypothetical protein
MMVLVTDQDREVLVQRMHRELLHLGLDGHWRHRLADAALDVFIKRFDLERVYVVEGPWTRPESSEAAG